MSDDTQRPIIVKRVKKNAHGHHGGAWKIAYADFVTAMMAFFLLMWLLGAQSKATLLGISDYFKTPLKVALTGGVGSGDTSSVIKGGGTDITRSAGQQKKGSNTEESKSANLKTAEAKLVTGIDAIEAKQGENARAADVKSAGMDSTKEKQSENLKAAEAELARQEQAKLKELKDKVENVIDTSPTLKQFKKQVMLDITSEGLRIQIMDEKNRPMFASGSARMQSYSRDILHEIGKALNEVPNRISLAGHTDATPYSGGEKGYSNWELSADRSNAARRELILGGMDDKRILRVVGLSSAVPFDKANAYNPINRRITIVVMNKKTEQEITAEGANKGAAEAQPAPAGSGQPEIQPGAGKEASHAPPA